MRSVRVANTAKETLELEVEERRKKRGSDMLNLNLKAVTRLHHQQRAEEEEQI